MTTGWNEENRSCARGQCGVSHTKTSCSFQNRYSDIYIYIYVYISLFLLLRLHTFNTGMCMWMWRISYISLGIWKPWRIFVYDIWRLHGARMKKNIVFRCLTPFNMADIYQPARLDGVRCQKIISHVLLHHWLLYLKTGFRRDVKVAQTTVDWTNNECLTEGTGEEAGVQPRPNLRVYPSMFLKWQDGQWKC